MLTELYPLFLKPTIKNYIWGGKYFKDFIDFENFHNEPIAEVWVIFDQNTIINGSLAGLTLQKIVQQYGAQFLGTRYFSQKPQKFPILIKFLDCHEWLSIQVHPGDEQAKQLEGPDSNGKTEGWFVIDAKPGAELIAGVKPSVSRQMLKTHIENGTILNVLGRYPIQKNDAVFIAPGTIHALGPGSVIYEIQQNSDITYRIYDWERPLSAGRVLHLEKSIAVANTALQNQPKKTTYAPRQNIFSCDYFSLDLFQSEQQKVELSPNGESFHSLTIIEGQAFFESDVERFTLNQFESVLIPASHPSYHLQGNFQMLLGSLNEK